MTKKVKVLWVSDGGAATGFTRVANGIIENLPENKYEIHHLAVNYMGDPYNSKALMYPAALGGDLFGFNRIKQLVDTIKPDLVFLLNDLWNLEKYLVQIEEYTIPKVVYFPVDAKPQAKQWVDKVIFDAVPVAYTEYGKSAITDYYPKQVVHVIPHGINTKAFHKVSKSAARKTLAGVSSDDFIVLSANRNQPRKRLDITIKGFALFAKDKPKNVRLYLHCGVEDMGWNIITLCDRYKITDRLLLTSLQLSPTNFVSDARLNNIYNSADVGITTSMGEGWSLTNMEMAACGVGQIVPNSSATAELYKDRGLLLPIDHYDTYPGILTEGAVTTPEAVAVALNTYYNDRELLKTHAQAAHSFFTQKMFQWKTIAKQWDKLFTEVLKSKNANHVADTAS